MAIGAALYAVFSWLFNGTVFFVPSVSQVALRPAIAIPMFFGYAFGPVVGFFTGAVGNMFGDALTGFGLSPQWSIGNGLIGFISGLWMLFRDRKQSMNTFCGLVVYWLPLRLYCSLSIAISRICCSSIRTIISLAIRTDLSFCGHYDCDWLCAGLGVRYFFGTNENIAAAVTWGMLGNIVGLLFCLAV